MNARRGRHDLVLLAGLARGRTTAQIAIDMGVNQRTLRTRGLRLRRRLEASNSAHAVALAYQLGWMEGLAPEPRPLVQLPDSQMIPLTGLARGLTNEQLAAELCVSTSTINFHLSRAYRALGATGRTHAVALAYQHGHLPRPYRRIRRHPERHA